MSNISAIYIIQYLDNFEFIINKHQELYSYFKKNITELKLPIKLFPSFHNENKIMPSCFCILFDNPSDSLNTEERLLKNNIFCRKYYHPLANTKMSSKIFSKILCLPCNIDVSKENIQIITHTILTKQEKI